MNYPTKLPEWHYRGLVQNFEPGSKYMKMLWQGHYFNKDMYLYFIDDYRFVSHSIPLTEVDVLRIENYNEAGSYTCGIYPPGFKLIFNVAGADGEINETHFGADAKGLSGPDHNLIFKPEGIPLYYGSHLVESVEYKSDRRIYKIPSRKEYPIVIEELFTNNASF